MSSTTTDLPLHGKHILVTGATSGIGFVTARELARLGGHVILVGRNAERCAQSMQQIRSAVPDAQLDHLLADLSSQAQIRALAEEFGRRYDRLDILVNNAGAYYSRRMLSPDGLELTFALNHLSYFLLTNLLLDALRAAPAARVVSVSSQAHRAGSIKWDDLQATRGYNGWFAYAQSKLANLLFAYELARRFQGTQITSNALHPGFVASQFGRNNAFPMNMIMQLFQVLAISPEKGAQTSIYLAASPEVAGVSGKYFADRKAEASSPNSYREADQRRLWELSEQICGLVPTPSATSSGL